jgi:hypothetical protein
MNNYVFKSVLPSFNPACTVTITFLKTGELEITFDSQNETWGERLNTQDTQRLAQALARPDTPQENKP